MDELRYMERKGFVSPIRARLKRRKVRQYDDTDIRKVQLIIKYRRQGFTWDAAFEKSQWDLENPPLL
jgi:DNA-binding transcriptional MerR regulator